MKLTLTVGGVYELDPLAFTCPKIEVVERGDLSLCFDASDVPAPQGL
jgi:hypothetical protein